MIIQCHPCKCVLCYACLCAYMYVRVHACTYSCVYIVVITWNFVVVFVLGYLWSSMMYRCTDTAVDLCMGVLKYHTTKYLAYT